MTNCTQCGRERTADDLDYTPMKLIMGLADAGWYSGDDGEICGQDMVKIFREANGS